MIERQFRSTGTTVHCFRARVPSSATSHRSAKGRPETRPGCHCLCIPACLALRWRVGPTCERASHASKPSSLSSLSSSQRDQKWTWLFRDGAGDRTLLYRGRVRRRRRHRAALRRHGERGLPRPRRRRAECRLCVTARQRRRNVRRRLALQNDRRRRPAGELFRKLERVAAARSVPDDRDDRPVRQRQSVRPRREQS